MAVHLSLGREGIVFPDSLVERPQFFDSFRQKEGRTVPVNLSSCHVKIMRKYRQSFVACTEWNLITVYCIDILEEVLLSNVVAD